jgi:hypothetical protein
MSFCYSSAVEVPVDVTEHIDDDGWSGVVGPNGVRVRGVSATNRRWN